MDLGAKVELVILGKCPSAFFVSVSEGRIDAFVGVLGGMVGGAVFTLAYPWIKEFMGPNLGNLQVTDFFTDYSLLVVLIFSIILLATAYFLPTLEYKTRQTLKKNKKGRKMAHIKLPEFEDMTPAIQEKARPILEKTGKLGEIFKLLAIDEKVYFATDGMIQKYLLDETTLSYDMKESIALLISVENGCKMCVEVHKSIAKMLGLSDERIEEILHGVENMNSSDAEKALLNFSIRASKKDNYKVLKEDIDRIREMGWSDVQIIEAVAITGYFNYINTLSNVFGLGE